MLLAELPAQCVPASKLRARPNVELEVNEVYRDDYPTCAETYATFRLFWKGGPELSEVSALLQQGPTAKADHRARGRSWRLSTRGNVESRDVRRHVDWLLEWARPRASVVEQLSRQGVRADVFCFWRSEHGHGGPMLSARQLAGLGSLGLEIGFDVYGFTPGGNTVAGQPGETVPLHQLDLDAAERELLRRGLSEWGGPTRCTEEMAIALGFGGVQALHDGARRLRADLEAGRPLTAIDWARVFTATEVVFASHLIGSGLEWSITTGRSDEETLALLRRAQRKLPREVFAVIGDGFGSRPVLGSRARDGAHGGGDD